jgi:hypothetical protein
MRQKITTFALLTAVLAIGLFATIAVAKEKKEEAPKQVLIKNVNIFDGKNEKLAMGQDVLVEGNLIKKIAKGIKASGAEVPAKSIYEETWVYVGAQSVAAAKAMLLRGFTTVRDVGGPVGGLKQAIDEGLVEGPRILPSGPYITQTSGHADLETSKFKLSPYFAGVPDKMEIMGWANSPIGSLHHANFRSCGPRNE